MTSKKLGVREKGAACYVDRCLTMLFVCATVMVLVLRPASAADLRFQSNEIMGYDWALAAGGATRADAGAGHGFIVGPHAVYGTNAQSELQISGNLLDIFDVGPTFGVTIPLESEFPDFNMFWLAGSSSAGGSFDSSVRTHSGFPNVPVAPARWIIEVLPTGDEVLGTPTRIDIRASLTGDLTVSGNGSAAASWFVSTEQGTILDGSAAAVVAGSGYEPISEMGHTSFLVPLGGSFELDYRYELMISGADQATARAEISESFIDVTATVVPEPSTLALVAVGAISFYRRRR